MHIFISQSRNPGFSDKQRHTKTTYLTQEIFKGWDRVEGEPAELPQNVAAWCGLGHVLVSVYCVFTLWVKEL